MHPVSEPPPGLGDRLLWYFRRVIEITSAVILAVDLVVVFFSVVFRYLLHDPLQWADEVAQLLMIALTFVGAAAALARGEHKGVLALRARLSARWQNLLQALSSLVIAIVAFLLCWSAFALLPLAFTQTTPSGLSESLFFFPVAGGGIAMIIFALAMLLKIPWRTNLVAIGIALAILLSWAGWNWFSPDTNPAPPIILLGLGFVLCLISGIPISFSLGFAALIFLWTDGTLPVQIYAQQIESGINNFVFLAVPFFVLAGLVMDVNGMSARLVGLLRLLIGKVRGGLQVVMIASMALFSGVSGSKNADVAAVGSILIPAMREDGQDLGDSVGLLAATAVMGETIPPCINIIILGSVANISIGSLFAAGLLPAVTMALALVIVAVLSGPRRKKAPAHTSSGAPEIKPALTPAEADIVENEQKTKPPQKLSLLSFISGGALTLIMLGIIFGGILGGIATPTEVSAFAVVFALVAGGLAFRQLTPRSTLKLFVDSASLSGMILFIVAVAQMVAYILTIQEIPQSLASFMTSLAASSGIWAFLLVSIVILIIMGSVLEGAPALVIFGPLLLPIATQLGVDPLHYGIVVIIAMGLGLFAPPLGVGLYTACAVGGVSIEQVTRPTLKYLAIIFIALLIITFVPWITLVIPQLLGAGSGS